MKKIILISLSVIVIVILTITTPTLASSDPPKSVLPGASLLGLYEIDPGIGINIGGTRIFHLGESQNQPLGHGIALSFHTLIYFISQDFDIETARMGSVSVDAGLGYGISSSSAKLSLTANIPVAVMNFFLFSENPTNTSWDFFDTDATYLRLHGSWFPFRHQQNFFSGLGLGTAFDFGLNDTGNRLILGVSF